MAALATREYWDARYELDKLPFDWYCRFNTSDAYKNLVCALIKKEHTILIVGAGTSRLPEELIEAEYNQLCGLDYSAVAVAQLKARKLPGLKVIEADATDMSQQLDDESFDAVIDKATFDSILCGEGGSERAERFLSEVARVLKPGGIFSLLSNAPPEQRLATYFEKDAYGWACKADAVAKPGGEKRADAALATGEGGGKAFHHFTMVKRGEAL